MRGRVILTDLLFLASVLLVLILLVCVAVSALRGRWDTTRRMAKLLGWFVAGYATALIAVALALPRRLYAAGERRCFDDWCVAALGATVANSSTGHPCQADQGSRTWVAVVEVSSVAKRVRQRARDARAELEDREGKRYQPCAAPIVSGTEPRRFLSDELGPDESFRVLLPFLLPANVEPSGLVMHHGDFPGVVIIGADQSFLHRPALQRFTIGN
jgi:hypothetical protein